MEPYLQRGTLHSDSLQARAWSCKRYHILLHRLQPPEARTLHVMPCRNSPFTLLHLGYRQAAMPHWDAWTNNSSIFRNCCSHTTTINHINFHPFQEAKIMIQLYCNHQFASQNLFTHKQYPVYSVTINQNLYRLLKNPISQHKKVGIELKERCEPWWSVE